jgi:hypothetical protein
MLRTIFTSILLATGIVGCGDISAPFVVSNPPPSTPPPIIYTAPLFRVGEWVFVRNPQNIVCKALIVNYYFSSGYIYKVSPVFCHGGATYYNVWILESNLSRWLP